MLGNTIAAAAASTSRSSGSLNILLIVVVLFGVLYFVMIRPQRNRQRKVQEQQNTVAPGVRVRTTAGMYATVVDVDGDDVILEVAPGVEVRYVKRAIMQVIPGEDGSAAGPGYAAGEEPGYAAGDEAAGHDVADEHGDEPVTRAGEEPVAPAGEPVAPAGETMAPAGAEPVPPDGETVPPAGETVPPAGAEPVPPAGETMAPAGGENAVGSPAATADETLTAGETRKGEARTAGESQAQDSV